MAPSRSNSLLNKVVALAFIAPAIVTVVVGFDYVLRGLGIGVVELHIPRSGVWAFFVGLCCLGTGWVAKQGLTALWKRL